MNVSRETKEKAMQIRYLYVQTVFEKYLSYEHLSECEFVLRHMCYICEIKYTEYVFIIWNNAN